MEIIWADQIKALEQRGWSLTEIGRAIGKSPQTISDLKQGRTREPGGMAAVNLHHLHSTGAQPPEAAWHDHPDRDRRPPHIAGYQEPAGRTPLGVVHPFQPDGRRCIRRTRACRNLCGPRPPG
jgi:hypothetical protein